jgi:hypothetical protein
MENDSVRSSGESTLVDMWIDGKLRAITVSREAIDAALQLSPERASALTDDQRREFVRTNLTRVVAAATEQLRAGDSTADTVTLEAGHLGGRIGRPAAARRSEPALGERRRSDRRKGDRRKAKLGPPPTGERRR